MNYQYSVTRVNELTMEVLYTSPGLPSHNISMLLPTVDQTAEQVIRHNAPIADWQMLLAERVTPAIGLHGTVNAGPPPETLENVYAAKVADLAAWRYSKEVSGIYVGGAQIRTDRESQAQITSAFVTLSQGFVGSVSFKAANGWAEITLVQLEPIARAVSQHVQACFDAEKLISEALKTIFEDITKDESVRVADLKAYQFPNEVV